MNAGLSHLYKSWTPTVINHFFQNQKVKIDLDPSRQPYVRPLDTWQNLGPALSRGEFFCKGHQDMYHTMM